MFCFPTVDRTHIDTFAEGFKAAEIIVESPGRSTTSKVIVGVIAFFSLGTGVLGCVFLATGTIGASGCYALIGTGGFILIVDAGVICLICRAQRNAVAELNAYLGENPQLTMASDVYNVRAVKRSPVILHFSKKSALELLLTKDYNRMRALVGHAFDPSQLRYFCDETPVIDLTTGRVATVETRKYQSLFKDRIIQKEEEIRINGCRVLFSCDLNTQLAFGARYNTDFVAVRETETEGVYSITEFQTNDLPTKTWIVNTHRNIRFETRDGSSEIGTTKVFVVDEVLPGNFDALGEGTQLSPDSYNPLANVLIKWRQMEHN